MLLRCGRWVQIILAFGLGLVQCENLNKERVTGPRTTVDAVDDDEGAMLDAGSTATPCTCEHTFPSVQSQSKNKAMIYGTHLYCNMRSVIEINVCFWKANIGGCKQFLGPPSLRKQCNVVRRHL